MLTMVLERASVVAMAYVLLSVVDGHTRVDRTYVCIDYNEGGGACANSVYTK